MKISDLFSQNQISNQSRNVQESTAGNTLPSSSQTAQLKGLVPGQIVRGELVADQDGNVQIRLAGDVTVEAKLDRDLPLELGKMMDFQVRGNGQTLTLTPLQANLSMEGPVYRALEMANLPLNSATGELTALMMKAGLSIDKNSLQQVYRELIHFPGGQAADLVDLHRLGMPVTEENLNQIASYKNLTHQLTEGLNQTSAALMDTISDLVEEGKLPEAGKLFADLISVMKPDEEAGGQLQAASGQAAAEGSTALIAEEGNIAVTSEEGSAVVTAAEGEKTAEVKVMIKEGMLPEQGASADSVQMLQSSPKAVGAELVGGFESLLQEKADYGYSEALTEILQTQSASPEAKLEFIQNLLKQGQAGGNKELLQTLLDSPQAKQLLMQQFQKQWKITPEQVADSKEIEHLYNRLDRQLKGITNALQSAGLEQGTAFGAAGQMSQNLDFMNQLNQMYAYVQLPLKLQQGEAHGDLYVYTNKKNFASKDEPITALLHLDMEHLGPLDVYVSMQTEKVSTKFYVQDEEMLDFLEEHMDLLTARLEKRGYQMTVQTSVREKMQKEENSGIGPILAKEQSGMLLQHRGFDVRT